MEKTLILVKPDATERNISANILSRLENAGLKLVALKMLHLDKTMAEKHYAVHADKPFFHGLIEYITSAPIVAAVFSGENAVNTSRKAMGATDPAKAEKGTIRADYGENIERNSVHGSDSATTAEKEINLFFSAEEIFD